MLRALLTASLTAALPHIIYAATPELMAPACAMATDATAITLAERFSAALQTRHPDRVTRLYAGDSQLQGFASPVTRADYASMREYFLYFLQFEPTVKFEDRQIDVGCNFLIDSGNYVWSVKTSETAQPQKLPGRYRMIYEHNGADWQIAEHIEELTSTGEAGLTVPDPQPARVPVAVAPIAPAVAGFLKRTIDDQPMVARPLTEQRRQETEKPKAEPKSEPKSEPVLGKFPAPSRLGVKPSAAPQVAPKPTYKAATPIAAKKAAPAFDPWSLGDTAR